jgi:hypothetical protein
MKNAVSWDVMPCRVCNNRRFVGTYCGVLGLLVAANIPSSPSFGSLKMEATCFFETSVLTRATQHNIPEDGILHYNVWATAYVIK